MIRAVARVPMFTSLSADLSSVVNVRLSDPAKNTQDGLHYADGVAVPDGARVAHLVQRVGSERGIYIYNLAANRYDRASDMPAGMSIAGLFYIYIIGGNTNAGHTFQLADVPSLIGEDSTEWVDIETGTGIIGANKFVRGSSSPTSRDNYAFMGQLTSPDMPSFLFEAGTIPNNIGFLLTEHCRLSDYAHAGDLYDQSAELDDLIAAPRYNYIHLNEHQNTNLGRAITPTAKMSGKTLVCYGKGFGLPGSVMMTTNARLVDIGGTIGFGFKGKLVLENIAPRASQNGIIGTTWFTGFSMEEFLCKNYHTAFNIAYNGHGGYTIGSIEVADFSTEIPFKNTFPNAGKGRVGRIVNISPVTIRNSDAAEVLDINVDVGAFMDDQTTFTGNVALTLPAINVPDGYVFNYSRSVSADAFTVSIKDDTTAAILKTVVKLVGARFVFRGSTATWKYVPPGGT